MIFVKANKLKFEEYGQTITTERQLSDGDYIKHFELTGNTTPEAEQFIIDIRTKTSFDILTQEQMEELLRLEPTTP
jgi:hypothetical protein